MARDDHDFVLTLGSEKGRTNYKVYVQGECWAYDDTDEAGDQQHSAFYRSGHVYPSYVDKIAVKGTVDAINHPGENNNPTYDIGGQRMSKQEVLDYSGGDSSGSSSGGSGGGGASNDASGEWNAGDTSGDRDLDPKHGVADRPLVTDKDRTIVVGSGGDCGTVQEAFNRMPRFVEHQYEVQLKQGTHSNEPGNSVNVPPTMVASAHGEVRLVGDSDNHDDYVLEAKQLNFQFNAGTAQNVGLEGVTVRGTVQVRRGVLELDHSEIIAGERWNKGDAVPLDFYNGHCQVMGTTLRGDGAAVNMVENSSVSFDGDSKIDVSGPLVTSGQHGGEVSFSGDLTDSDTEGALSCARLTDQNWDQSIVDIKDPHGAVDGIEEGKFADVRR